MPERQCHGCTRQKDWGCTATRFPSSEENPEATRDKAGNWWGWHNGSALPLTIDGEDTHACPRQDVHERAYVWQRMFLYYGMFKNGFLPQAGAIMDQSNKAVEVFRVFDDANAEADNALAEQQRQTPGAGNGKGQR